MSVSFPEALAGQKHEKKQAHRETGKTHPRAACTSHQAFGLATESPESSSIKGQRISTSWAGLGWAGRHCCQTIAVKKEVACLRSAARQKFYSVQSTSNQAEAEDEGKKVRSLSNIPLVVARICLWSLPSPTSLVLFLIAPKAANLDFVHVPQLSNKHQQATSPRTIQRNKPLTYLPSLPPLLPGYQGILGRRLHRVGLDSRSKGPQAKKGLPVGYL